MRRPGLAGSCWPDNRQEEALRAALAGGQESVAAWERLAAEVDPELHRLLPLVSRTIESAGDGATDQARLAGLYRHTWYLNQRKLYDAAPWLEQLTDAGFDTMVLKGTTLSLHYYDDLGVRPMADVDIMVPLRQADRALDHLEAAGWRDIGRIPRSHLWRWYHGSGLVHPSGAQLDVHWYLGRPFILADDPDASSDDFWADAQPFSVRDVPTHRLSATDELLHTCMHGTWAGSAATVRWVADAVTVLRAAGSEIRWARVIDQARRRRMVVPLRNAFAYLIGRFDAPIPGEVVTALRAEPTTRRERRRYRITAGASEGPALLGGLVSTRAHWAHVRAPWGRLRSTRELPGFLADLWRLDHVRQLPLEAARKAWRRTGLAIRGSRQ